MKRHVLFSGFNRIFSPVNRCRQRYQNSKQLPIAHWTRKKGIVINLRQEIDVTFLSIGDVQIFFVVEFPDVNLTAKHEIR